MKKFLFLLLLIFLIIPFPVSASDSFITVVNPVRVARNNPDLLANLKSQYSVIAQYKLPATWLLTYDIFSKPEVITYLKKYPKDQELGLFLEVSPEFAQNAGIEYNKSGSWHFGSSVFLTGYRQENRIKLIDTVFEKFKSTFGYYPSSVGAWWIDGFSEEYMHKKFGVTAVLDCSDQYSTDNYQIWGQYWSTPFYPSKIHAGVPAQTESDKSGVVTLQWAARHPKDGYNSSLYSTQDYLVLNKKYDTSYFKNLLEIYLSNNSNDFSQITVGLESDLSPETYQGEFKKQMMIVGEFSAKKTTMKQFSEWYIQKYPTISPAHIVKADGYIWYQSHRYRLGIDEKKSEITDFRIYPQGLPEPYLNWFQSENDLRIYIPAVIDSLQTPSHVWHYEGSVPMTSVDHFELDARTKLPDYIKFSSYIKIEKRDDKIFIYPNDKYPWGSDGIIMRGWTPETVHLLKSPRTLVRSLIFEGLKRIKRSSYSVYPGELEALEYLRLLPKGKIIVYDHECLQCSWVGEYPPAIFANHRQYIGELSHKEIVYDSHVFEAKSREEGSESLKKLSAKYVYIVKYGNYVEKLPFSPGDLGIEKIYENAFAQIWLIK